MIPVFWIEPDFVIFAMTVKVWVVPVAKLPIPAVIFPLLLINPTPETKDKLLGNESVTTTFVAKLGPLFFTVMV